MDNGKFTATIGDLVEIQDNEKLSAAIENLKNCEVFVDIETSERQYADEVGQAMSKITFTINLSQSKFPWQPHVDQAWDIAGTISEALVADLQHFIEERE